MAVEAWAYIDADKRILIDTTVDDPDVMWRIALGWPTRGEVEYAKANGCRVVRVRIEEVSE